MATHALYQPLRKNEHTARALPQGLLVVIFKKNYAPVTALVLAFCGLDIHIVFKNLCLLVRFVRGPGISMNHEC